ncbi:MAG TPA: pilus assembly protein [Oligoflexia bacterium]|nr:pilus assembly protein [Oligoflexia bacterium]
MQLHTKSIAVRPNRSEHGATMVEFAIGGATFLFLLIAGIEVGRYLFTVQRVQHVLNELSRATVMGRLPEHDQCLAAQPITSQCRARSAAEFIRAHFRALGLSIEDATQFGMCVNVAADVNACKAQIAAGAAEQSCYLKQNPNCSGLHAGDASNANQLVYLQIRQPIRLIFDAITVPIKAGVIVKNEPFYEEG